MSELERMKRPLNQPHKLDRVAAARSNQMTWGKVREFLTWKKVVGFVGVIASLGTLVLKAPEIIHFFGEIYGPVVIFSAFPATKDFSKYGERSYLYEMELEDGSLAKPVIARHGLLYTALHFYSSLQNDPNNHNSDSVWVKDKPGPIPIMRFKCKENPDIYKLYIMIQNKGDRTAEKYKMTIRFSGRDKQHIDPGVRIVHVESDALEVGYLYQQHPQIQLPTCIKNQLKAKSSKEPAEKVSELARLGYQEMGLTRDVVILSGSLEAHLFQTINMLLKVPSTEEFLILYDVECANCQWFIKTNSFGQIIQPQA